MNTYSTAYINKLQVLKIDVSTSMDGYILKENFTEAAKLATEILSLIEGQIQHLSNAAVRLNEFNAVKLSANLYKFANFLQATEGKNKFIGYGEFIDSFVE